MIQQTTYIQLTTSIIKSIKRDDIPRLKLEIEKLQRNLKLYKEKYNTIKKYIEPLKKRIKQVRRKKVEIRSGNTHINKEIGGTKKYWINQLDMDIKRTKSEIENYNDFLNQYHSEFIIYNRLRLAEYKKILGRIKKLLKLDIIEDEDNFQSLKYERYKCRDLDHMCNHLDCSRSTHLSEEAWWKMNVHYLV